jgi:hypothetical protein
MSIAGLRATKDPVHHVTAGVSDVRVLSPTREASRQSHMSIHTIPYTKKVNKVISRINCFSKMETESKMVPDSKDMHTVPAPVMQNLSNLTAPHMCSSIDYRTTVVYLMRFLLTFWR